METMTRRQSYESAFGIRVGDRVHAWGFHEGVVEWIKDGYSPAYGHTFRARVAWDQHPDYKIPKTSVISLGSIKAVTEPAPGPRVEGSPTNEQVVPAPVGIEKEIALLRAHVRKLESTTRRAVESADLYQRRCVQLEYQTVALRHELADIQAWIERHDEGCD